MRNKRGPRLKQMLSSYVNGNSGYACGKWFPSTKTILYFPGIGLEYVTLHEWGHMINGDQGVLWYFSRMDIIDCERKAWLTASTFVKEELLDEFVRIANTAFSSYDWNTLTLEEVRKYRKLHDQEVRKMVQALGLRTVKYKGKTRVLKCCCADPKRWDRDEALARDGVLTIHDTDEIGVETPFMTLVEEQCKGCGKYYWFTTAGTGKKRELE